jgi:hypothetical protein
MPVAVPIKVVGEGGATVPGTIAVFYWLDQTGEIAKVVEHAPIENGVAQYNAGPPPSGAFFGISVHEAAGSPIFRSGRLTKLPGPPSSVVGTSTINVFRSTRGAGTGLNSEDAAPQLVRQRLAQLSPPLRIDDVELGADNAGHEVVIVKGRVRRFLISWPFVYTLALALRPATHPGHPEDVIIVEPAGPGSATGVTLGNLAASLDQAIVEGVKQALETGIRHIAVLQQQLNQIDFPAKFVSLTTLAVVPHLTHPSLTMQLHSGAISGTIEVVTDR